MPWLPIAQVVPQEFDANGDPYVGAVYKFYSAGTSTNINLATDSTGGTTVGSIALDSNGNPSVTGSVVIPHIDQKYKLALYPTQAAADADSGAIWTIDDINPADLVDTDTDVLAKVSSNDTTAGYLNGKLVAGDNITLTEGSDGGNETLTIATPSAGVSQITDHIRAGNTQIWSSTADPSAFSVSASLTENTWESVGPTGSGADNIWTGMDNLPASATILLVRVQQSIDPSGTSTAQNIIQFASGALTMGALSTAANPLAILSVDSNDAAFGQVTQTTHIKIPLSAADQTFQVRYLFNNEDAPSSGILFYNGFMTN